jgi:hypothetical protein
MFIFSWLCPVARFCEEGYERYISQKAQNLLCDWGTSDFPTEARFIEALNSLVLT